MTAYNAKDVMSEAIESILNQSFTDFELIIVNDGASDTARSIIRSCTDKRVHVIDNEHDYIYSLNTGLKAAKGKYLARMDTSDIAHVDRLKIQYAIMEALPEITVCSSWIQIFGAKTPAKTLRHNFSGFIENPLPQFLHGNFVCGPSTMTRNAFIKEHNLLYEAYTDLEDYKFWVEAAKSGAVFYVESQPLVFKRTDDAQTATTDKDVQIQTASKIKREILDALCIKYEKYPALKLLSASLYELLDNQWIAEDDIMKIAHTLFTKNKDK